MKIAVLADIHVRNLKLLNIYREVFDELYGVLKEREVDTIVLLGDLAHSKLNLSPEFVDLVGDFLFSLSEIAPTYTILGNHDLNVKNLSRQDAISPIVKALDHKQLHLFKTSQEVSIGSDIILNTLSIIDESRWILKPTDPSKINIALYHGAVKGCSTDLGWAIEHGDTDIETFKNFDYALLGDIHKTNSVLSLKPYCVYPGSLIQQNFAETNDKGFLLFDIRGKTDFDVEHIQLHNPSPFITIELTKSGRMPKKLEVQSGARLRLVSQNNLPFDTMKRAMDVAQHRFKPESITYLNRSSATGTIGNLVYDVGCDNLRDPTTQENLIREYLKNYEAEEEIIRKVIKLNSRYNSVLENEGEPLRNVRWRVKRLDFDNLFNYGENNNINFSNLSGIIGILGKNFSGKTSAVEALLYTIFNTTSKNERKNYNVINQNRASGRGFVELEIGNDTYHIERISEKYEKTLKGETTQEAKTTVDFRRINKDGSIDILNGASRNDTDKEIRRIFGQIEDFLLTSLASQFGSMDFLGEGSTKRKEILQRFLDLEVFDRKFKAAKDEIADLRGALKALESRDFPEELKKVSLSIKANRDELRTKRDECETIKNAIASTHTEISDLERSIESIPTEIIDIIKVRDNLQRKQATIENLQEQNTILTNDILTREEKYNKIETFLNEDFSIESHKARKNTILQKEQKLSTIEMELNVADNAYKFNKEKTNLLEEVPCGTSYETCKFIKGAHEASKQLEANRQSLDDLREKLDFLQREIKELDPVKTSAYIEKYEKLVDTKQNIVSELSSKKLARQKNKNQILETEHHIKELRQQIEIYEENKEVIENKGSTIKALQEHRQHLSKYEQRLSSCDEETLELVKYFGSLEQQSKDLEADQHELHQLRDEYQAYDLLLRCFHSNGITNDIITRKLPIINDEVAKVLANVVDFSVFFETEGKKLNIFIKHPKHLPRPLEMGSGAEKALASMAIRLALIAVSSLPKASVLVLDEPGASFDPGLMEGFTRLLEVMKNYFETVILISHIDELKDSIDQQIVIEKINDYAKISV